MFTRLTSLTATLACCMLAVGHGVENGVVVIKQARPAQHKSHAAASAAPLALSRYVDVVNRAGLSGNHAAANTPRKPPTVWALTPRRPYFPKVSFVSVGTTFDPIDNEILFWTPNQSQMLDVYHQVSSNPNFVVDFSVASLGGNGNITAQIVNGATITPVTAVNGHILTVVQPTGAGNYMLQIRGDNNCSFAVTKIVVTDIG